MTTFRPMDITTNAADLARLYSYTVAEPITAETAHDWWMLCEWNVRITCSRSMKTVIPWVTGM